jgi:hypothetical protein
MAGPGGPDGAPTIHEPSAALTQAAPGASVAAVADRVDRVDREPINRPAGSTGSPVDGAAANGASPGEHPGPLNGSRPGNGQGMGPGAACTAPQLRRFIKSRPYVPMHELRRRFAIDGGEDDVTPVDLTTGRIYVGLPSREGSLLGELLRGGEVGYELSLDPRTPVVVGLYPMRPVARG